ncbi:SDR family oxidoreductase [uncultured Cedecea sp.]|uniref:SDR family oxidoreductase n=1 Tax=uncultured Cedecea sp. TaxID=988762 RepID=UPI002628D922|nr:SDR family oxidoreductase [uncultured Cedecea sp.]
MNKILVTGATGFLGGAITAELIKKGGAERLLLLARGDTSDTALSRVKKNLIKFGVNDITLSELTSLNIIEGDLSKVESFIRDKRLDDVEKVINCAAIASFGNNPMIWRVNVEGTFQFASRMSRVKSLQRFIHVGTAMSCTPAPNTTVVEDISYTLRENHLVEYTWSKATIETMMQECLPELPLIIARPSIVVGHTQYGCIPSASIFWVFRMALKLGKFMCNLSDRVDVIPVDYCAQTIIKILYTEELEFPVYHISSGQESSVSFAEIDRAMAKAAGTTSISGTYQKVNYKQLSLEKTNFKKLFGDCNERIVLKAMSLYGQFSKMNVVFNNERIIKLGMPLSPKFTDYIDVCHRSVEDKSLAELMAVDFK